MGITIAIVINKDTNKLGSSETFLRSHIECLPCNVVTLIGNPGYRYYDIEKRYVPSRKLVPLIIRWIFRKLGFSTVLSQDRRAVRKFLRQTQVSAVLAEYGPTAITVMDACQDENIPLIAQFHGYDAYRESLLTDLSYEYKRLFAIASAVIAVSLHMKKQLIRLGADPDKTYHNACGANIPDNLKANLEQASQRYIMVGRLVEKKAPFISIMAFARVACHHQDAALDVIGDGPLISSCKQMCRSLNIDDKVFFHGAQPHNTVLKKMAKSTCFVQHSVCAPDGDKEGTPVSVLEAMGMGLPIVSTRHGGIMDVIENRTTGMLVEEYDLNGMTTVMNDLADDRNMASKIGKNARIAVLEHWTNEKSIERLWGIIDKKINRSAGNEIQLIKGNIN